MITSPRFDSDFKNEVYEGLTAYPKYLSSKYFYDEEGSKIFQEIMAMPEYYVTDAETEVFNQNAKEIAQAFTKPGEAIDIVELGAGDGTKTRILLKEILAINQDVNYVPIDISVSALVDLEARMNKHFPTLKVQVKEGTYFKVLGDIKALKSRKKVILFLGSNIGNLTHPLAREFMKELRNSMNENDVLFIGMDQKKDPETILNAYNDATGITARFNLNILKRINRELDANFKLDEFVHTPVYDPETGTCKSFLVSKSAQSVAIKAINLKIKLNPWESIHTEISQKYDDEIVQWLAKESELKIITQFSDSRTYFTNYLFSK